MEYCPGGDLLTMLQVDHTLEPPMIKTLLSDIAVRGDVVIKNAVSACTHGPPRLAASVRHTHTH